MASPINNLTKYAVAAACSSAAGELCVAVVVKSTWQPGDDGEPFLSEQQQLVLLADEPDVAWGGILRASDMGGAKWGCDVVVVGDALVPTGGERRVVVSVGDRALSVLVRHVGPVPADTNGDEGVRVPLVYAFSDYAAEDAQGDQPKDQLAHIRWDEPLAMRAHEGPAGFGPMAANAACRARHCGASDDSWMQTRMPLAAADQDPRSKNVAHPALQFEQPPAAGQMVVVDGMTGVHSWRLALPDAPARLTGVYSDGWTEHLWTTVDTLVFEPSGGADGAGRMTITARAALPLRRAGGHALQRIEVAHG